MLLLHFNDKHQLTIKKKKKTKLNKLEIIVRITVKIFKLGPMNNVQFFMLSARVYLADIDGIFRVLANQPNTKRGFLKFALKKCI